MQLDMQAVKVPNNIACADAVDGKLYVVLSNGQVLRYNFDQHDPVELLQVGDFNVCYVLAVKDRLIISLTSAKSSTLIVDANKKALEALSTYAWSYRAMTVTSKGLAIGLRLEGSPLAIDELVPPKFAPKTIMKVPVGTMAWLAPYRDGFAWIRDQHIVSENATPKLDVELEASIREPLLVKSKVFYVFDSLPANAYTNSRDFGVRSVSVDAKTEPQTHLTEWGDYATYPPMKSLRMVAGNSAVCISKVKEDTRVFIGTPEPEHHLYVLAANSAKAMEVTIKDAQRPQCSWADQDNFYLEDLASSGKVLRVRIPRATP